MGSENQNTEEQAPLIPDLKKKKEERKKSGVAAELPGGQAAEFTGARAGAAASRAAAAAARAATMAAEGVEGAAVSQGGFLAQLMGSPFMQAVLRFAGTFIGKVAIGIACAALVAGIGAMMKGGAPSAAPRMASGPSDMGGDIKSTIRVHMPSNKALDYAARAAGGALHFGDAKKTAPPPAPTEAPKAAEAPAMPEGKDAEFAGRPDMPHGNFGELSGAKLSTSFGGGGSGASFGKNDVFGSGPQVASVDKGKIAGFGKGIQTAHGSGLSRYGVRGSRAMNFRGGRASKALGQLRTMGPVSADVKKDLATGTGEAASADATKQFEGASPTATAPESPAGIAGAGPSGGPGSIPNINDPNVPAMLHPPVDISACTQDQINNGYTISDDGTTCQQPKNAGSTNDTPWQSELDAANDLNLIASGLITTSAILAMIAAPFKGSPWTMAFWASLAGIACALAIIGAICGLVALILGAVIMGKGGGMQGFGVLMGGAMNTLMGALGAINAYTNAGQVTLMGVMGAIMGIFGLISGLAGNMFGGGDPNVNKPTPPSIQDMGMLPPPPDGQHWESSTPNDPNPKDYQLVPDGNPPGNAPSGSTWVHDKTDSGWSLMPTPPNGPDGKPLPQLPPGEHYENGKPAQDGMAPYAAPSGDHWMHNDVPNSDPNAWILYDANGKQVGNSAGVSPNGDVYTVNGPNTPPPTAGQTATQQKDPNYPPCNQQAYVTNGSGQTVNNPNCGH